MGNINFNGIEMVIPENWTDQGMMTFTLPSPDPKVKPNIILTKERLPQPIDLKTYFFKIKETIQKRGIKDFKISDEREIILCGVKAMQMICSWDVSAMKKLLGPQQQKQMADVKPGQHVKQVQISILKDQLAINMTASFPAEQFDIYYRPFQNFLKTFKVAA